MVRAFLVKLVAAALVVLEAVFLPSPASGIAIALTVLGVLGFFAYVIVAPGAQFLVPSSFRLPAHLTAKGTPSRSRSTTVPIP